MALLAIALGVGAPLPAGTTRHEVQVEALSHASAQATPLYSYVIRSDHAVYDEHSLRHREAVDRLRTALSGLGLFEAPAGVRPDLVIQFDYGLGQPRTVYVETREPVYELRPGPGPAGLTTRAPDDRSAIPVGYAMVKHPVVVREKYVTVTARANVAPGGEARPLPELWRVSARIEDVGESLRNYLPVLAAAVMEQAGLTTDGNVALRVADNSASVAFIRRGF